MRKPLLCLTALFALSHLSCSRMSFVNPNGQRVSSRTGMTRELRECIHEEREKEEAREHYDQASKAADYYNMQRVPPGEDSIPTDRYQKAVDHARLMNRYESASRTILPSEASMSGE